MFSANLFTKHTNEAGRLSSTEGSHSHIVCVKQTRHRVEKNRSISQPWMDPSVKKKRETRQEWLDNQYEVSHAMSDRGILRGQTKVSFYSQCQTPWKSLCRWVHFLSRRYLTTSLVKLRRLVAVGRRSLAISKQLTSRWHISQGCWNRKRGGKYNKEKEKNYTPGKSNYKK